MYLEVFIINVKTKNQSTPQAQPSFWSLFPELVNSVRKKWIKVEEHGRNKNVGFEFAIAQAPPTV